MTPNKRPVDALAEGDLDRPPALCPSEGTTGSPHDALGRPYGARCSTIAFSISNGVLNLTPDKAKALGEMAPVLKPTGRLQIGDITIDKPVPDDAKQDIDLWTG